MKRNQRRAIYASGAFLIVLLGAGWIYSMDNAAEHQQMLNQRLQVRQIKLQKLNKDLQSVKQQKAESDAQIQQKAQHEADLQRQIDELNKQLQAKLERERLARIASAARSAATPRFATASLRPVFTGYSNTYDWGYCTWGVASWTRVPNNLGNANTWDDRARAQGYTVSATPRIGAVAQTDAGSLGHVALVVGISGGQVQVKEMNVRGLGVTSYRWTATSAWKYIYF